VKPETTRGARKLLPRRKRGRSDGAPDGGEQRGRRTAAVDPDFDPVEFAEFLEADEGPLPIDPAFRERLREQLWEIVRDRAAERSEPRASSRPRRTP
jgi:hypothetical protein